jgi:predicted nucleotidyltransferase component of viral defense system
VIHPNIIKRKADKAGFSAPVVERDYVLAHVLSAISKHADTASIVFKGGTALRLCYFEDYRYSADLDFSLINDLSDYPKTRVCGWRAPDRAGPGRREPE